MNESTKLIATREKRRSNNQTYRSISRLITWLAFFGGVLSSQLGNFVLAESVLDQATQIFQAVDGQPGKKTTLEARYSQLQKVKPNDNGSDAVHYAYMLALVELHKQREAVAYAEEWLQRNPRKVRCRLLRARLLLREKKFAEVFVDLETTCQSLAELTKKETLDVETEVACRAMGLMLGYIEGPAKQMVKATLGKGIKERLLTDFSPAAKQAFMAQYDAVQEEHKELIEKGEEAFLEMQSNHREAKDAADERRAQLEAQKWETEQQKQAQIDQIAKKWDSAKSEYDRLAATYLSLEAAQAQLVDQRTLLAGQAAAARPLEPEKDKSGKISSSDQRQYERERRRYNELLFQVNLADQRLLQGAATLQQVWSQGAVAEANLVRLQVEGKRLGVKFDLADRAFAKKEAQLNREDPSKKKPPRAISKQFEQSFALYDDFSYMREKQRLLDHLQASK